MVLVQLAGKSVQLPVKISNSTAVLRVADVQVATIVCTVPQTDVASEFL